MSATKLILVIGATGAQGLAVIDALLAPNANGKPSPYSVCALTRDPAGRRALELSARGVEVVKGIHILPAHYIRYLLVFVQRLVRGPRGCHQGFWRCLWRLG
jgi:hypothetical protein